MCFQILKLEQEAVYKAVLSNREQSRWRTWRNSRETRLNPSVYAYHKGEKKAQWGKRCIFPAQWSGVISMEELHLA